MYVPVHFREERIEVLHAAIRTYGFGTLVTSDEGELEASHLPLLLDAEPAPFGTLRGHLARANPQWRRAKPGVEALAIFLGPDAYVTPSWYPTKQQTGKVVPTWNYLAIHVYGTLSVQEDPAQLRDHVGRLTDRHEATRASPWAVDDAPEPYIDQMLRAIVGVTLRITRIEGKWKMSQNRTAEDQTGVREGLAREAGDGHAEVGAIMAERAK